MHSEGRTLEICQDSASMVVQYVALHELYDRHILGMPRRECLGIHSVRDQLSPYHPFRALLSMPGPASYSVESCNW